MTEAIDLRALLGEGVAVVVATADPELRPQITRGWGPQLGADGETVRLCVGAALGAHAREPRARRGHRRHVQRPQHVPDGAAQTPAAGRRRARRRRPCAVEAHVAAFDAQTSAVGLPLGFAARLR